MIYPLAARNQNPFFGNGLGFGARAPPRDARSGLLHPAAACRGGLTPAGAPLIKSEKLFRQTEPPLADPPMNVIVDLHCCDDILRAMHACWVQAISVETEHDRDHVQRNFGGRPDDD